jgi:hypothetical protein
MCSPGCNLGPKIHPWWLPSMNWTCVGNIWGSL